MSALLIRYTHLAWRSAHLQSRDDGSSTRRHVRKTVYGQGYRRFVLALVAWRPNLSARSSGYKWDIRQRRPRGARIVVLNLAPFPVSLLSLFFLDSSIVASSGLW
jgi:hypothetical protein